MGTSGGLLGLLLPVTRRQPTHILDHWNQLHRLWGQGFATVQCVELGLDTVNKLRAVMQRLSRGTSGSSTWTAHQSPSKSGGAKASLSISQVMLPQTSLTRRKKSYYGGTWTKMYIEGFTGLEMKFCFSAGAKSGLRCKRKDKEYKWVEITVKPNETYGYFLDPN